MNKPAIMDIDSYFERLESRYKRFMLQQLQTRMEHAGYKGLAFLHILYYYTCLYNILRSTPQLGDIISLYNEAFTFDKRTAASKAVAAARYMDFEGLEQLAQDSLTEDDALQLCDETQALWLHTVWGFEKAQAAEAGATGDDACRETLTAKLLVRHSVLKDFVRTFTPPFNEEQLAAEAEKISAIDEEEQQNMAVMAIGNRLFPQLFIPGYTPAAEQEQVNIEIQALELDRHEWLGTQVQLAELYIELEGKGWIRKKIEKTIQASFTKSNTIDQVLKPGNDLGKPTYPNVYRTNYSPAFGKIPKNKKLVADTERVNIK